MSAFIKVILKQTGQVKKVKQGYAFNYLLPRGLAVIADKANLAAWQDKEQKRQQQAQQAQEAAKRLTAKLEGQEVVFNLKGDVDSQKLHQSVTKAKLARRLKVDKKDVKLPEPIKKAGSYQVVVKKGRYQAKVTVVVKIK